MDPVTLWILGGWIASIVLTAGQYPMVWFVRRQVRADVDELTDVINQNGEQLVILDGSLGKLLEGVNESNELTKKAMEPGAVMRGGHDPRELQELGVESRLAKKAERELINNELAMATIGKAVKNNELAKFLWNKSGLVDNDAKKLIGSLTESGLMKWLAIWKERNAPQIEAYRQAALDPKTEQRTLPLDSHPGY